MATDMQSLFSGLPSQGTQPSVDSRDRPKPAHNAGGSREFDSVLERAESRQNTMRQEPVSGRAGAKRMAATGSSRPTSVESSQQQTDRPAVAVRREHPVREHDQACATKDCGAKNEVDAMSVDEGRDEADEAPTQQQEMLLAAMMMVTAPVEDMSVTPSTEGSDSETESDVPVLAGGEAAAAASIAQRPSTVQPGAVSAPALSTGTEALGQVVPVVTVPHPEPTKTAEIDGGSKDALPLPLPLHADNQHLAPDVSSDHAEVLLKDMNLDSNRMKAVLTAAPNSKTEAGVSESVAATQVDRPAFLEGLSAVTSLSRGQEGATADTHLEKESQQFSDSAAGNDRSLPGQMNANGSVDRSPFLDRMNGIQQPAVSSNDSASSRTDAGQATAALRVAESERLSELRGTAPVSQSVMLELDPLDMGPLRVRVMMSDQTVHAHIRTEHGELGQGLLQQGQSLESSLRTTGLEMGMLRVTVDQQQGRSDTAWMFQQQSGRSATPSGPQSTEGEEERSAREESRHYTSERVSIFA